MPVKVEQGNGKKMDIKRPRRDLRIAAAEDSEKGVVV